MKHSEKILENFRHQPSWIDAGMALEQVRRKKANAFVPALMLRSAFQKVLWKLGCFIQKFHREVLIVLFLAFCLMAIGLKDVKIETDLRKLWVPPGGRLEQEQQYIHTLNIRLDHEKAEFARIIALAAAAAAQKTTPAPDTTAGGRLDQEKEYMDKIKAELDEPGGGIDTSGATLGGDGGGMSFQMLIQTPLKGQDSNILNKADFLAHAEMMRKIAKFEIEMFGEKWKMKDLCYKPDIGTVGPSPATTTASPSESNSDSGDILGDVDVEGMLKDLISDIVPCVIISPLDCFFEGSKALGPFPPIALALPQHIIDLVDLRAQLDWQNLNPGKIVGLIYDLKDVLEFIIPGLSDKITPVKNLFDQMGIGSGYQEKECLNPYDPKCPETAPNYESKQDADINTVAAGGCQGIANKIMDWPLEMIIGGTEFEARSDNVLSFAGGIQSVFLLAGIDDVYNRYKHGGRKQQLKEWSKDAAKQLLNAYQRNFSAIVYQSDFNSNGDFQKWYFETYNAPGNLSVDNYKRTIDVENAPPTIPNNTQGLMSSLRKEYKTPPIFHPLAGTSLTDMMKEFSKFNPTVIIIGYVVMIVYTGLSLLSCTDGGVASCCGLGIAGVLTVTFATGAGLGCSTIAGIQFNAATTNIVPFLTLGLGVDDMFLLIHSYIEIIKLTDRNEIGYLLCETGLSVLLTSINNILAFLCGGLLPVPALRSFCWQVAILLFFNMLAIITFFPAIITIDLIRQKNRRMDILCCIQKSRDRIRPEENDEIINTSISKSTVVERGQLKPRWSNDVTSTTVEQIQYGSEASMIERKPQSPSGNLFASNGIVVSDKKISGKSKEKKKKCSFGCEEAMDRFINDIYAPFLSFLPVKICTVIFFVILFAVACFGVTRLELGLELTDVVPKGTAPYDFLAAREKYFSFYPMNGVVRGAFAYDTCYGQYLFHTYRAELNDLDFTVQSANTSFGGATWLHMLTMFAIDRQEAVSQAKDKANSFLQVSPSNNIKEVVNCANKNKVNYDQAIAGFQLLLNQGDKMINFNEFDNHQLTIPLSDSICQAEFKEKGVTISGTAASAPVINPAYFYNVLALWFDTDSITYQIAQGNILPPPKPGGLNSSWSYVKPKCPDLDNNLQSWKVPPARQVESSQFMMFLTKLTHTEAIMDAIVQVRDVSDSMREYGLDSFPDGIPFVFWEQYLYLVNNVLTSLAIIIAAVFVVISVLLMNPWVSGIVVLILIMMVVELAGFMGLVGLKLNAVSAVIIITAVGIGVEFTVHLSLSFLTALGTRNARMTQTLHHMFLPVMHGGLSTLLGIIMLAFSEFEFIVKYFFVTLAALIVLGLINGLWLLPVLLSLIGPPSEVRPVDGLDTLDPPTPPGSPGIHSFGDTRQNGGASPVRSLATIAEENNSSPTPKSTGWSNSTSPRQDYDETSTRILSSDASAKSRNYPQSGFVRKDDLSAGAITESSSQPTTPVKNGNTVHNESDDPLPNSHHIQGDSGRDDEGGSNGSRVSVPGTTPAVGSNNASASSLQREHAFDRLSNDRSRQNNDKSILSYPYHSSPVVAADSNNLSPPVQRM